MQGETMLNTKAIEWINKQTGIEFDKTVKKMADQGILFVMPAFYPQRGGILEEYVNAGGKAVIAGGAPGQQLFKGIPQYSPGYDTTGISETPKQIYEIVQSLPDDLVREQKVALFVEAPVGHFWSANLKHKKAQIVASNEQNLRLFFEEKTNLQKILFEAGLQECFIPSEIVKVEQLTDTEIDKLYSKYQGQTGKVVLQSCGAENFESGGGKGTSIVKSFEDFCENIRQHKGTVKVAKFIEGYCSNLSMFAGNMQANKDYPGMMKGKIPLGADVYNPELLHSLVSAGEKMGITEDKIVVLAARASLKAVGNKNLTASPSNGVGNSLGYEFNDELNSKIGEIAHKLGTLMAKCGKVGLCGADLIIDKENHIWINEVNDRQQGPTEQLSRDAEQAGAAGIHRLAFLSNYADCRSPEMQKLFYMVKQNSEALYQKSLQSPGSFYIKLMGKHQGKAVSQVDLKQGTYEVKKQQNGMWEWNLTTRPPLDGYIDLNQDRIFVGLAGVSLKKGQKVPSGAQILRIVGKAKNGSSPFLVKDNEVVLNKKWLPIVNNLYHSMFGKNYNMQQKQKGGVVHA